MSPPKLWEGKSYSQWARELGSNHGTISKRVEAGLPPWERRKTPKKLGKCRSCERDALAKDLCQRHYYKERRKKARDEKVAAGWKPTHLRNVLVEGKTIGEWSEELGLSKAAVSNRIKKGLPLRKGPVRRGKEWGGKTAKEWAKKLGITHQAVYFRISTHGSPIPRSRRKSIVAQHKLHECQEFDCMICRGGLVDCTVCGGAEGAMPTECPGYRLSGDELDAIYSGRLDFAKGKWLKK